MIGSLFPAKRKQFTLVCAKFILFGKDLSCGNVFVLRLHDQVQLDQLFQSSTNSLVMSLGASRDFEGAWVDYHLVNPTDPFSRGVMLDSRHFTILLNGILADQGPSPSTNAVFAILTYNWGSGNRTTILEAYGGTSITRVVLDGDALPTIHDTTSYSACRASVSLISPLGSVAFPYDGTMNLGVLVPAALESLTALTENDLLIASPPSGDTSGVIMYAGAGSDTT